MSNLRCGHCWLGSREATTDRHRARAEPSDAASSSSAAAPIRRRMSAAPEAAAMIAFVRSRWFATGAFGGGPPAGRPAAFRGWDAGATVVASSSAGLAPDSWAAVVAPADVPMTRSASVTSTPASRRPPMTPTSHALPVDPPPPRTNARPRAGSVSSSWRPTCSECVESTIARTLAPGNPAPNTFLSFPTWPSHPNGTRFTGAHSTSPAVWSLRLPRQPMPPTGAVGGLALAGSTVEGTPRHHGRRRRCRPGRRSLRSVATTP
jgi:hypothetical protein